MAIRRVEGPVTIGQPILEQCGPAPPPGMIAELAAEVGLNSDTVRKLRAIAAPGAGYTRRELHQWFKVFRKEGQALTISHLVRLVSVPKGETRNQLTQQALNRTWSAHRLQNEILALKGRRRQGGRRPNVVAGKGFTAELSKTLWAWERWLGLHLQANPKMPIEIVKELRGLKKKIEKADKLLQNQKRDDQK